MCLKKFKGFPKKKGERPFSNRQFTYTDGYNQALDDCKLYIAKIQKELTECREALDRAHKVFGAESDKLAKMMDEGRIEKAIDTRQDCQWGFAEKGWCYMFEKGDCFECKKFKLKP